MTNGNKNYLASDLAVILELPRSTINDWLARYSDYLEVELRGKRKAYTAKSLRILREISDMRNEGKSSFEIEQLLAERYGIRPEVAAETGVPAAEGTGNEIAPSPEAALPVLRPAFEQVTGQINAEFTKLAERLEQAERERRKLVHKMWAVTSFSIVGMAALVLILVYLVLQVYGNLDKKNRDTAEALAGQVGALGTASEQQFGVLGTSLDRSREDFEKNVAELKSGLAEQRKAFEAQLKEMEKEAATRSEAQMIRLREEFAKKQKEELNSLLEEHAKRIAELKNSVEAGKNGEFENIDAKRIEAEKNAARIKVELERERGELEALRARIKELEKLRTEPVKQEPKPEEPADDGAPLIREPGA